MDNAIVGIPLGDALMAADEELQLYLPKHNRCGAHTVNLMATSDVSEVIFSTLIVNPDPILFPVLRIRDVYLGFRILIFTHPGSLDFFPLIFLT